MNITPIKTSLVHAGEYSIKELIVQSIAALPENTVVCISSKVIALCQNRVVDKNSITKSDLIKQESDYYTPDDFNKYGFNFTITNNTFISSAGIDESNTGGYYVLWPKNPQQTANEVRALLRETFNVRNVGVIITDSSSMPPMRSGAIGIMLAHSGFLAVKRLAGTKDLFGRNYAVSTAAIGSGLAAAANVAMGEGAEQTPIAIISDAPFVTFQDNDPTKDELESVYLTRENDLYAPFFESAPWQTGSRGDSNL